MATDPPAWDGFGASAHRAALSVVQPRPVGHTDRLPQPLSIECRACGYGATFYRRAACPMCGSSLR